MKRGGPEFIPGEGEKAPQHILMTSLSRTIHAAHVVSSPGEESWDVFDLKLCAE